MPIGIGILVVLMLIIFPSLFRTSINSNAIIVESVKRGTVENTLSAEGVVEPFGEMVLVSPATAKIKSIYQQAGAVLDSGQVILELDAEFMALEYKRLEDELRLKDNNVQKLRLELEKTCNKLNLRTKLKICRLKTLKHPLTECNGCTKLEELPKKHLIRASRIWRLPG